MKRFRPLVLLPLILLAACKAVVLAPSGDIALQQRDLVVIATLLMLVIIVPVMALTIWFAWRYRQSNKKAEYEPDWNHSTQLELVIWAVPLLIIICLGAVTWVSTHLLDPYRALGRISADANIPPDTKPLEIDVVALDWKWLFIYPEYKIATVNVLAAPVDRAITFHITAANVMNSFYIPALAGQIYAMPGMETPLHAVINEEGDYRGFSANYSGAGFSGMHFVFHGMKAGAFEQWVATVNRSDALDRDGYLALAQPSSNVEPHVYALKDAKLYDAILMQCVEPGQTCANQNKTTPTGTVLPQQPTPETNDMRDMPDMPMHHHHKP